jgi:hypothetical protein
MSSDEALTAEERATVDLVVRLIESGNLHPLIARLRHGEIGPENARDALRVLAELDLDLLLQIALDALIGMYLEDPGLAHQPRREVRGGENPTR